MWKAGPVGAMIATLLHQQLIATRSLSKNAWRQSSLKPCRETRAAVCCSLPPCLCLACCLPSRPASATPSPIPVSPPTFRPLARARTSPAAFHTHACCLMRPRYASGYPKRGATGRYCPLRACRHPRLRSFPGARHSAATSQLARHPSPDCAVFHICLDRSTRFDPSVFSHSAFKGHLSCRFDAL